jgi:DNA-binding transcriptional ArsR family regulator
VIEEVEQLKLQLAKALAEIERLKSLLRSAHASDLDFRAEMLSDPVIGAILSLRGEVKFFKNIADELTREANEYDEEITELRLELASLPHAMARY